MVYKFLILSDEVDHFAREIEIDSEATFLELNDAILESVGYAKDQLTSFFICEDNWEKKIEVTLMDMETGYDEDSWVMGETRLSELLEDEKQRMLFVFDNMTERAFFIELREIITGKNLKKAVCTQSMGNPPAQTVDFEEIHTEGISKITPEDIAYAKAMGRSIKLLATSRGDGNGYYAMVAPFMLGEDHPLNNVNGVFNAIFVHGNMLGDAMFYGSGAGKLPTASAVAADIVDIAKHLKRNIMITYSAEKMNLLDYKQAEYAYFVRTTDSEEQVKAAFDNPALIKIKEVTGETAFVTAKMKEETYLEKAKQLSGIKQMIRVD